MVHVPSKNESSSWGAEAMLGEGLGWAWLGFETSSSDAAQVQRAT